MPAFTESVGTIDVQVHHSFAIPKTRPDMKFTVLSAVLTALYLSQAVHGYATGAIFYSRKLSSAATFGHRLTAPDEPLDPHRCGVGATAQPTDPNKVSGKYNINADKCHGDQPKWTDFWAPRSKDGKPHCLHMSTTTNCDGGETMDFIPNGQFFLQ